MSPSKQDRSAGTTAIGKLAALLHARPDSEHEMSYNRFAFCILMTIWLLVVKPEAEAVGLLVMAAGSVVTIAIFLHILWRPQRNPTRRVIALIADIGTICLQMHLGGARAAVFYPLILWTILGNGFRFGLDFLFVAMAAGLTGFAAVALSTPFWRENASLTIGLLAGLAILPLYAGGLIRKLSVAKQHADKANQAKSLFLASVSHELRTPLNAIIGMGGMLRETALDAHQTDMAQTMAGAANALLSMIDGILEFSRIEAGRMPVNTVAFDLRELLADVTAMIRVQARAKQLRLALHVTPRTPLRLLSDPRHLRDILLNLTGNAIKFTSAGGVLVAVDAEPLDEDRIRLRCEVVDTGIGIAPEAIGHIFDRFTQADPSILDRFGGTGLGLAVCRELAKLLGGDVGVTSEVGKGSVFWFTVEARQSADPARPAPVFTNADITMLSADSATTKFVADRVRSWGAAIRIIEQPSQAAALLLGPPADANRIIIMQQAGLDTNVTALASALQALNPDRGLPIILIGDAARGVSGADPRWDFVSLLDCPVDETDLCSALHFAGAKPAAARPATARPDPPADPGRGLSILLAEDNRTNQRVIRKIMESAGHRIVVVDSGESALDALDTGSFDAVLMDVNMPKLNGIDATKLYRFASLGRPHLPIFALTADATPEMAQRCLDAGMDACVTKPVEPAKLLDIIGKGVPDRPRPTEGRPHITDITAHPRFRPAEASLLDETVLERMEALGGEAFVTEVFEEFVQDADALVGQMATPIKADDLHGLHTLAHAMRSGAANVGATRVFDFCQFLEGIDRTEMRTHGEAHLRRLADDIDQLRRAFARRQQRPDQAGAQV